MKIASIAPFAAILVFATPAVAMNGSCDKFGTFAVNANRFDTVAQSITHASGCTVTTDLAKTGAVRVRGVKGRMTYRQAISRTVQGSKLKVLSNAPNHVTIR